MIESLALSAAATSAPADRISLRTGPLTMIFEGGDLRYIKFGELEIIRRIYAAVRDRNWGTVPGAISDLQTSIAPDSFRIAYVSTHRRDEIHFVWQAEIAGQADGTIRFTFDGEARTTFLRNRIGFCVLHPPLRRDALPRRAGRRTAGRGHVSPAGRGGTTGSRCPRLGGVRA